MHGAGCSSRKDHPQPSGEFGIGASGERRGFLVPTMDVADLVRSFSKSFDEAIYAISR
jgi:hypothetical protein